MASSSNPRHDWLAKGVSVDDVDDDNNSLEPQTVEELASRFDNVLDVEGIPVVPVIDDTSVMQGVDEANIESLLLCSEEISAAILVHLSVREILLCSVVSRPLRRVCRSNNVLWKRLFRQRWNVDNRDDHDNDGLLPSCFWYDSYQAAHLHPHDLWITHWNCLYPPSNPFETSPGRCFIRRDDPIRHDKRRRQVRRDAPGSFDCLYCDLCPSCRLNEWPLVSSPSSRPLPSCGCVSKTATKKDSDEPFQHRQCPVAQILAHVSLPIHQALLQGPLRPNARGASSSFAQAATNGRTLCCKQFEKQSSRVATNFLTDLLFFNLVDATTTEGQCELQQLREELAQLPSWTSSQDNNTGMTRDHTQPNVSSDDATLADTDMTDITAATETTYHSWHACQLYNPDFVRPILFSIGIMGPECFTVYPSEGWIAPGASLYVTFGVRALGSAEAFATKGIDGLFQEFDSDHAENDSHLPMTPFVVRYHFCTAHPAATAPLSTHSARSQPNVPPHSTRIRASDVLAYYKQHHRPVAPHHIRTIYLSAHVNANYHFADFAAATCHPWTWRESSDRGGPHSGGPIVASPMARERHPRLYHQLQDGLSVLSCRTSSISADARSCRGNALKQCAFCRRSWGLRSEELWQTFLVAQSQWSEHRQRRDIMIRNIARSITLATSPKGVVGNADRLSSLFYVASCLLQVAWNDSRRTSPRQRRELTRLQLLVDRAYAQIPAGGVDWIPWCKSNDPHVVAARNDFVSVLGLQQDKDRAEESDKLRHDVGCAPDILGDNMLSALKAGVCMFQAPQVVALHGIFDMIRYPGSVTTRPQLDVAIKLEREANYSTKHWDGQQISREVFAYYWIQGGLDLCGLAPLANELRAEEIQYVVSTPFSLHIYLHGDALSSETAVSRADESPDSQYFRDEIRKLLAESAEPKLSNEPIVPDDPIIAHLPGRRRLLQRFWDMGIRLGLVIPEQQDASTVYVERTILIVLQWFSVSFAVCPILLSLLGRYSSWIPCEPLDYSLVDLPFRAAHRMRFLSADECGLATVVSCLVWLALLRWAERNISRDFFRILLESIPERKGFCARLLVRYERKWDAICPLFLQRRIYAPDWNRRTRTDLIKRVAHCRHPHPSIQQVYMKASSINLADDAVFGDERDESLDVGGNSMMSKVTLSAAVALGSFCACTPLIWLNVMTVLSCGIGLGMSVSIASLEQGSSCIGPVSNAWPTPSSCNLATLLTAACLMGQLIGSSGGILFLAEFLVTFVSLFLGGAAAVSFGSRESWGCLILLSIVAFFGYILGRVATLDGVRYRRRCYASFLLSRVVLLFMLVAIPLVIFVEWDTPVSVMIVRPEPNLSNVSQQWTKTSVARKLQ